MTLSELQGYVSGFVQARGLEAPAEARLLDLTSEVGELADVFFALLCLANVTGVTLEALAKYKQRLAAKGDASSGR